MNDINLIFERDIAAKFLITLGDEFQGLLFNGENIMHIINKIKREMYPVQIRFGVGVAPIHTKIDCEMALGADGPGYYKARAAINHLKKREKGKESTAENIHLLFVGKNQIAETMLNTILTLLATIESHWSERQREVIEDMLIHQDNQTKAAKRLNMQQPSVQKTLVRGNYYAYRDALNTVVDVLKEIN